MVVSAERRCTSINGRGLCDDEPGREDRDESVYLSADGRAGGVYVAVRQSKQPDSAQAYGGDYEERVSGKQARTPRRPRGVRVAPIDRVRDQASGYGGIQGCRN